MANYEVGKIVSGSVTGIETYGIFVNLLDYYSGLIHISEISEGFVKDVNDYVKIGDTIKAKVLEVDEEKYQVKLSIKGIDYLNKKPKRTKIEEQGSGFSILKTNLDEWMSNYKG